MAALLILFSLLLLPCSSPAASVTLAWDPNTEPDLAGYKLHYGPGSQNYTVHLDLGNVTTWAVDDLTQGTTYYFAVTAYDRNRKESGYSNEVAYTPPVAESISKPNPPSGPTSLQAGVAYVFTTGGAASSAGDELEYIFFWSDGTDSGWLPAGTVEATKSWSHAGSYTWVQVQARCATHPTVVSTLSDPITVTVESAPAETVSQPAPPSGPTSVSTLALQSYATGSAVSSAGHAVQYRFLWADGTVSPWLAAGQLSAARSWSIPGTYAVRSEARCQQHPTVHSPPSGPLDVQVEAAAGETISEPTVPTGPADARTGQVAGFVTGGAASNTGDPLQYRFQWGDGSASPWFAPGSAGTVKAWKSWADAGVYTIFAEVRCALHPLVPAASRPITVSVTGGDSLLISDTFSDGTPDGDPQWKTLSGRWLVGADKTFASGSLKAINRSVVAALPDFKAGRVSAKVRLSRGSLRKSTGIVFALADTRHYRYVSIQGSRITLGQVGAAAGEKGGVKASANRSFRADRWYRLRVDIQPGGRVSVFIDNEKRPVLTGRFAAAVGGGLGVLAQQSVAYFDDFRAWDERALR